MPYTILFVAIFIFMGFSLVFRWLLNDNLRHLYIVGLTLFYALCTLIRRSPDAAQHIDNITNGWGLVIYAFFIMMSIWCAVSYVMHIIPDNNFRATMGVFMLTELIAFLVVGVLRYYNIQYYLQIFFICMLVLSAGSVIIGICYAIKNWKKIQYYDKIMLIATFCMIFWFMGSFVFNLQDSQYVYLCGSGILLYFLAYTTVSAMRLHHKLTDNSHTVSSAAAYDAYSIDNNVEEQNDDDYNNLLIHLTQKEQHILDIMSQYNFTNTKDILKHLPNDATENGVNTALSRLMKKSNAHTRKDLIDIYNSRNT